LYIRSDSDHDDEILQADSTNISPSGYKRRVSFLPKAKNNINGKSPTTPVPSTPGTITTSPVTKMRRRRLRTTSRSGDDRISFRGQNPIYTAGIYL
jgi:hypothetical protein